MTLGKLICTYCFFRPKLKSNDPNYNLRNNQNEVKVNHNHKTLYKANSGLSYILNIINIFSNFNRTLDDKLKKVLYLSNMYLWISKFSKIIKTYDNTYHRTIKMNPVEVNKNDEKELLSTV
ncbi:hypothetical protein QTP88_007617 [Uroleucon formosanum]